MTATFVSISFEQGNLFLSCPLLPLHPPAATQLMFIQARTGYQLLYQQICFSHLFLSSSNQFLDGLLLSLVSTNAIDPSHNWDPYSGTLTLSQRVSNTNPAPPAGPLILQISHKVVIMIYHCQIWQNKLLCQSINACRGSDSQMAYKSSTRHCTLQISLYLHVQHVHKWRQFLSNTNVLYTHKKT